MRFIIFTLLCCFAGAGAAQPPASLTMEAAVASAAGKNPRLLAAARTIEAAEAGVRSASALTNPTFFFSPSVPNVNGATEELLFTQPLELNGTRSARTGIARAQLNRTQAEAVVELRNVVFAVKMAYYELARAQEQLALARDLYTATEEFDRLTRRTVELGSRPGIDRTQTGIEAIRARQQMTLAESEVQAAEAALNTLMGREPEQPIGALKVVRPSAAPVTREERIADALANRAEIAGARFLQEGHRAEARLARAEGRPDLAPQFRAQNVIRSFTPQDYGFSVVVTLPFLDWGSRRSRVRQAESAARAEEARIAAVENQVRQEVTQALARYRAAETVSKEFQTGLLEQAKRLLDGSTKAFQTGAGGASVLTVLEAQRTYRSVQSDYINAQVNLAKAYAELERATGSVPASLLREVTTRGADQK